jgi:DNA modification methylase
MRLSDLKPADYNPRRISAEAKRGLRASIERFGLVQPIIFNERTGRVVGGHQRLDVLVAGGETETDVVVVDLPESEEKALNVALNSPAISGEFTEDLDALLAEIRAIEPDLFDELLLDQLIAAASPAAGKTDPDAVPEPPAEPVSKPGELYVLGNHRLLCGDATNPEHVARLLGGEKPRLMLTDPPYGVSLDMEWRDRAGKNALGPAEKSYMRGEGHANTSISGDTKADWSDAFELVPSLDTAYVWHASAYAIEVGTGLRRIGFDIKQQIIWMKPRFALSRQHYHWQHEPCWYARKPGSAPFRGARDQSTIWEAASPKMIMGGRTEEKVDHPTQKPAALYTRPIANHLERGACFYEPFGGSGTAIIAAESTGTRCLAMEIDPRYVDVIRRRWGEFAHGEGCAWEEATAAAVESEPA